MSKVCSVSSGGTPPEFTRSDIPPVSNGNPITELSEVRTAVGAAIPAALYVPPVPVRILRALKRSKPLVRHIESASEEAVAYAAGLIDGDGCIGVTRDPQRPWSYSVSARVHMTERAPVEFMYRTFGGCFRGPIAPRKTQIRPVYEWDLSGMPLATFLTHIARYSQGKRELSLIGA